MCPGSLHNMLISLLRGLLGYRRQGYSEAPSSPTQVILVDFGARSRFICRPGAPGLGHFQFSAKLRLSALHYIVFINSHTSQFPFPFSFACGAAGTIYLFRVYSPP